MVKEVHGIKKVENHWPKPTSIVTSPTTKLKSKTCQFFKIETVRGFEQLSSSNSWRVMGEQITTANRRCKRFPMAREIKCLSPYGRPCLQFLTKSHWP